jgi:hypothetical protein
VGSHGKDCAPTTTEEHRKAKAEISAMDQSPR